MEVTIISRETIKPSFSCSSPKSTLNRDGPKPFKMSLLDQVTPATFFPFTFFFPSKCSPDNAGSFATRLKSSLSHALSRFYPFAGVIKNNLVVADFGNGVPFLEARVSTKMSAFLSDPKTTSLNRFLPCLPFRKPGSTAAPLLAVQVSEFVCGGVAVGVCASHKIADAAYLVSFLDSWASKTRENEESDLDDDVLDSELNDGSSRFRAVDPLPEFYTSVYENVWFSRGDFRTERFVFDAKALAELTETARTDEQRVQNQRPSRVQALSGFIWKSAMSASKTEDSDLRTNLVCQAVNLRRPRKAESGRRVGNKFWWSIAAYNEESATAEEKELPSLVELLCDSVAETKDYYMKPLQGDETFGAIGDHFRLLEELYTVEQPEIYGFTSWVNLGLDDIDFGLGKPIWVGTFGEVGPEFRNLIVLKDETTKGKGIEAWLTLEEKVLTNLKNDPHFLALASINPPIII